MLGWVRNLYLSLCITLMMIAIATCVGDLLSCPSLMTGNVKTTGKACQCHTSAISGPNSPDFAAMRGAANDEALLVAMEQSVNRYKCEGIDPNDMLGCERHDSVTHQKQRCTDSEQTKCPTDPKL